MGMGVLRRWGGGVGEGVRRGKVGRGCEGVGKGGWRRGEEVGIWGMRSETNDGKREGRKHFISFFYLQRNNILLI